MENILRSRSSPSDRIVVFGSKPCLNKRRILKEGTPFDRWNFLNEDLCSRQVTQVRLPWFSLSKSSMIKIFLDFKGTNVMASSVSRCDCCKIFIPPDDRVFHLIYFVLRATHFLNWETSRRRGTCGWIESESGRKNKELLLWIVFSYFQGPNVLSFEGMPASIDSGDSWHMYTIVAKATPARIVFEVVDRKGSNHKGDGRTEIWVKYSARR